MPKKQVLLAYVPVMHRGYWQFFEAFPKARQIYVLDIEILDKFDYIRKDLRALGPKQQAEVIRGLGRFDKVGIMNFSGLSKIDKPDAQIVMPADDIARALAKNISKADIKLYPVFLRWDRESIEASNKGFSALETTNDKTAQGRMRSLIKLAEQSSDIWRRVGASIIDKGGKELFSAVNRADPSEQTPLMEGDPRNLFKRGVGVEQSLFTHAEAALIARAADEGKSLRGATIYVTTFPCPACARLIAHSGIRACFYSEGYAVLDGARVLSEYGVKIIKVLMPKPGRRTSRDGYIPYKNKPI